MKIELTKTHFIIVAFALLFIVATGIFLYYRTDSSVDKRLNDLAREMSFAKADKVCQENDFPDDKCKEVKDKSMSDYNRLRLEFIAGINKECRDKYFTDNQCEEFKETYIKKLKEEIAATVPFSELDPKVRAKIDEAGNTACKLHNLSDEECKKKKISLMRMAKQNREQLIISVVMGCKQRGWDINDERCKEVEAKVLEDFTFKSVNGDKN